MLRPKEMERIIVTGPKGVQESVIKELHSLKVLHIVEYSKDDMADIGKPLENSSRLSEIVVKIRAIISSLGIKNDGNVSEFKGNLLDIERSVKRLADEVNKGSEELRRVDELIARNAAILSELKMLNGIDVPIGAFMQYKTIQVITGFVDDEQDVFFLSNSLSAKSDNFLLRQNNLGKKVFIALFIDKNQQDDAQEILQKVGFSPATLASINSNGLDKGKNAAECIKGVELQRNRLLSFKASIAARIKKFAAEHKTFLFASESFLSQELDKSNAPLKFAATKNAFLVRGWVPRDRLKATIDGIEKAAKNKIFIHNEAAGKNDKVPVKLDNPYYARPFEFLLDMYSLPGYKEIDPTFFVFLTFPVFFGFMLGDFGYGMASLALFYALKKKFAGAAQLFNILILSSISSIFFGLLFGEFFGLEEIGHYAIPHVLSRTHSTFELMYIAFAVGVIHVNWGLVNGFVNLYKDHGLHHAVLEKGSWIVLQAGIALLTLSLVKTINLHWALGAFIMLISIVMLYKGEGIKGLIELPSILTNTLSYLRLMAIGLSSVYIAAVVNEMSEGFFHEGGIMIAAGILILLVGHLLNLALGLFGSFLHSLRLHYVEFFSKFFHGGAERYTPFGINK